MAQTWEPAHPERLDDGRWIAAIRSAPWSVWAAAGLLLAVDLGKAVLDPNPVDIVLVPVALAFAVMLLAGIRLVWQLSLVLAALDVAFVVAPHNSVWSAAAGALAIVALLLPPSRRYLTPDQT